MMDSQSHKDVGWLLKERQGLSLQIKIDMTKRRLKEWYDFFDGMVYLSLSGGKDSLVLMFIIREMGLDIPSVFIDTGMEYPEVRDVALKYAGVVLKPMKNFRCVVREYGWPVVSKAVSQFIYEVRNLNPECATVKLRLTGKGVDGRLRPSSKIPNKWLYLVDAPFSISCKCCTHLKKNPAKKYEHKTGRRVIVATMADESLIRKHSYIASGGCNAFNRTRQVSAPMSFWVEQDVLEFIWERKLSLAGVYGELKRMNNGRLVLTGVPRTGCMFCAFGAQLESLPNRFELMRKRYEQKWKYVMFKMGMKQILQFVDVRWGLTVDERRKIKQDGGDYVLIDGEVVWQSLDDKQ